MKNERQITRRALLKKAAYVVPVVMTLKVTPGLASSGSGMMESEGVDKWQGHDKWLRHKEWQSDRKLHSQHDWRNDDVARKFRRFSSRHIR